MYRDFIADIRDNNMTITLTMTEFGIKEECSKKVGDVTLGDSRIVPNALLNEGFNSSWQYIQLAISSSIEEIMMMEENGCNLIDRTFSASCLPHVFGRDDDTIDNEKENAANT